MSRATAAAALAAVVLAATTCAPAVRHPAITAGLVGGVIGFSGCEFENISTSTCAAVGGVTGLFLGGIAALVLVLSPPSDQPILGGEPIETPAPAFGHKRYHPAPDAGVSIDAGIVVDATTADAESHGN